MVCENAVTRVHEHLTKFQIRYSFVARSRDYCWDYNGRHSRMLHTNAIPVQVPHPFTPCSWTSSSDSLSLPPALRPGFSMNFLFRFRAKARLSAYEYVRVYIPADEQVAWVAAKH